jgi:hypothetical protein
VGAVRDRESAREVRFGGSPGGDPAGGVAGAGAAVLAGDAAGAGAAGGTSVDHVLTRDVKDVASARTEELLAAVPELAVALARPDGSGGGAS